MINKKDNLADLKLIEECLKKVEKTQAAIDLFEKYEVDPSELYTIPIYFDENLEVSARTDHGIISLNADLKNRPEDIPSYLAHELTHYLQQTTGNLPTQGSNADDYLDNEAEQEGFRAQTQFLSETKGDEAAEKYIEKVLDHHEVPEKEKEDRKEELLELASRKLELLKLAEKI